MINYSCQETNDRNAPHLRFYGKHFFYFSFVFCVLSSSIQSLESFIKIDLNAPAVQGDFVGPVPALCSTCERRKEPPKETIEKETRNKSRFNSLITVKRAEKAWWEVVTVTGRKKKTRMIDSRKFNSNTTNNNLSMENNYRVGR